MGACLFSSSQCPGWQEVRRDICHCVAAVRHGVKLLMPLTSVVSDSFHVAAYEATASKYRLYTQTNDFMTFSGKLSLAQSFDPGKNFTSENTEFSNVARLVELSLYSRTRQYVNFRPRFKFN